MSVIRITRKRARRGKAARRRAVQRTLKLAASVVLVAGCVTAVSVASGRLAETKVRATATEEPKVSPSGPLVQVYGLRAGETRSADFEVTNNNFTEAQLHVGGGMTSGSPALYDVLTASVQNAGGTTLWSGRLRQLDEWAPTDLINAGSRRRYLLTVGVPEWAGNEVQGLSSEFDMRFRFELGGDEYDSVAPLTGIIRKQSTRVRKLTRRIRKNPNRKIRLTFTGRARDNQDAISRVEVSLVRYTRPVKTRKGRVNAKRRICRHWAPTSRRFVSAKRGRCVRAWATAKGKKRWTFRFPRQKLAPGRYELRVRAVDANGNVDTKSRRRGTNVNVIRFVIRGRTAKKN